MNYISTLPVFGILVVSTFIAYSFQNNFQTVSATIVSPQDQLMSSDTKEEFEIGQIENETAGNYSHIVPSDGQDKPLSCEMPPCPPDQACIQSCP